MKCYSKKKLLRFSKNPTKELEFTLLRFIAGQKALDDTNRYDLHTNGIQKPLS